MTFHEHRRLDLGVLDALRGLAALYVLLHHANQLLWTGDGPFVLDSSRGPAYLLERATVQLFRFGPQAVLLFFLISGFCIHYRQARRMNGATYTSLGRLFDWRDYAWRRFRRIYPVFAVALLLTATFDLLGSRLSPSLYPRLAEGYAPATIVGNLLMQSSLAVPTLGSDSPLWSLAYEFWFYVLYPAIIAASFRLGPRVAYAGAAMVALAAVVATPFWPSWALRVLAYWVLWATGALLAEAYVGRVRLPRFRWLTLACLVGFGLAVTLLRFVRLPLDLRTDILWGLPVTLGFAYLLLGAPRTITIAAERVAVRLAPFGSISYSLYVSHFPFLLVIAAAWVAVFGALPNGLELVLPSIAGALALAAVLWYAVERHCVTARVAHLRPEWERVPIRDLVDGARPARAAQMGD